MHLRACGVVVAPYLAIKNTTDGLTYEGLVGRAIVTLAHYLKFSFTLRQPEDGEWGVEKNGTWSGQTGMLVRNEADIAVGPFAMTLGRAHVIDYTTVLVSNYLTILAGKPESQQASLFSALLTFDRYVWLCVTLSGIVFVVIMGYADAILTKKSKRKLTKSVRNRKEGKRAVGGLWLFFSTGLGKGSLKTMKCHAKRVLMTFWLLTSLILALAFSGNLNAMLLLHPPPKRIESIADLQDRPDVKIKTTRGTSYETYLKTSGLRSVRELWDRIDRENGSLRVRDLYTYAVMREVQLGNAVIFGDLISGLNAVSSFCRLFKDGLFYFAKEKHFPHGFTMAVRKDLPRAILRKIKKKSRLLVEAGLFDKWIQQSNKNWSLCQTMYRENEEKSALAMAEMIPVFLLWLISLAFAIISLFAELPIRRLQALTKFRDGTPKHEL